MRRRAASGHDEGDVPWASFADALTGLLFVFMLLTVVFMQSAAKTQAEAKDEQAKAKDEQAKAKDEQAKAAKELDRLRGYGKRAEEVATSSMDCLEEEKIQIIKGRAGTPDAAVLSVLLSVGWFDSGKVTLKDQQCKTTKMVAECLAKELAEGQRLDSNDKLRVLVEGHTDKDRVGKSSVFPSNWELSGARAAAVVRALSDDGADCQPDPVHRKALQEAIHGGRLELIAVGRADQAPSKAVFCPKRADNTATADDTATADEEKCKCEHNEPTTTNSEAPVEPPEGQRECLDGKSGPEMIKWANLTTERKERLRRVDLRFEVQPKTEALDATP